MTGDMAVCFSAQCRSVATGLPYFLVGHVGDGNFHFGDLIDPDKPEELMNPGSIYAL